MAFLSHQFDRFEKVMLGSAALALLVILVMRFGSMAALLYSRLTR